MNYANSKDNKFYEKHGQTPPEVLPHLTEKERDELREEALRGHACEYVQRGSIISCNTGTNEHGKVIGPYKMLVRTENNQPILTDMPVSS